MERTPKPRPEPIDYAVPIQRAARTDAIKLMGVVAKNVVGWLMILASPVLGIALPGPGGIPVFIIGFALVTFPGKRRLTTRVMRGRILQLDAGFYVFATTILSLVATTIIGFVLWAYLEMHFKGNDAGASAWVAGLLLTVVVTWTISWLMLRATNLLLRQIPRIRRKFRPWLRRRGLNVLPPRHKRGRLLREEEILEVDEHHVRRLVALGRFSWRWLQRALILGLTLGILWFIINPVHEQWPQVRQRAGEIDIGRLLLAVLIFAVFLGAIRATAWRSILKGMGEHVAMAPALRIWITSELARYLPGAIWQVVGRVWLIRRYNVSGRVCGASQFFELALFLLANIMIALACFGYLGWRNLEGDARYWIAVCAWMTPLLALLVWPPVFKRITNLIMRIVRKPPLPRRLHTRHSFGLLIWLSLGLVIQSIAVWLVVAEPLHLPIEKWWIVAGAYCLAWVAGFLTVVSPGGLGVRELVFVKAMTFALPDQVASSFIDDASFEAFLAFLAILLRIWATAAEAIVAIVAHVWDLDGATKLFSPSDRAFSVVDVRPSQGLE